MTARRTSELLAKSLMLLSCYAATLLLWVPQQAVASILTNARATALDEAKLETKVVAGGGVILPEKEPSSLSASVSPIHATQLVVKLSQRRVYVYRENKLQASYPIGVGKAGWETPTGTYHVFQMIRNPAWQHPFTGKIIPPGVDNPLGTRWIGFWTDGNNEIGFHGTPQEELVGKAVSHGCVRMRNRDVSRLFEQVEIGTPVIVQP